MTAVRAGQWKKTSPFHQLNNSFFFFSPHQNVMKILRVFPLSGGEAITPTSVGLQLTSKVSFQQTSLFIETSGFPGRF